MTDTGRALSRGKDGFCHRRAKMGTTSNLAGVFAAACCIPEFSQVLDLHCKRLGTVACFWQFRRRGVFPAVGEVQPRSHGSC